VVCAVADVKPMMPMITVRSAVRMNLVRIVLLRTSFALAVNRFLMPACHL
jgi:hypothetical protein